MITALKYDHSPPLSLVFSNCLMSQSKEVWELIGQAIASRRWDVCSESHITTKLRLLSSSQQAIIKDIKRVSKTESAISCSTNKIYYICPQELYELLPTQFLFKINDKKMSARHINILQNIQRPTTISKLLTKFKNSLISHNIDNVTDTIIQIFVNMINYKHKPLDKQEASKRINVIKQGSLRLPDKVYSLIDMPLSFN